MGKKNHKGKPVVMTQAEFFNTQQSTTKQGGNDWGSAGGQLFGAQPQPKAKVVVAAGGDQMGEEKATLINALAQPQT